MDPSQKDFEKLQAEAYQRYRAEREKPRYRGFAIVVMVVAVALLGYTFISKRNEPVKTANGNGDFYDRMMEKVENQEFFTHLMEAKGDSANQGKATVRPATGYKAFEALFPFKDNCNSGCIQMAFQNASNQDGVVFLVDDGRTAYPNSHAYVRSGESFSFLPVPPGDYTLRWYVGADWRENQWKEKGKSLGAFNQVALPVLQEDSLKYRTYMSFRLRAGEAGPLIVAKGDSLRSETMP